MIVERRLLEQFSVVGLVDSELFEKRSPIGRQLQVHGVVAPRSMTLPTRVARVSQQFVYVSERFIEDREGESCRGLQPVDRQDVAVITRSSEKC